MNRSRISRLIAVTSTAILTLAALGAGGAAAKGPAGAGNPKWKIEPVSLPAQVAPGNAAGYFVTVRNNGTSTINALQLTVSVVDNSTQQTEYFSGIELPGGGAAPCVDGGPLVCQLGTFAGGDKVTFTVAYLTDADATGKTFDVLFELRAGTGDTGSDSNGSSRGDSYVLPWSTNYNRSANFDGGFVIDQNSQTYQTTGDLGRANKQNSSVEVSDTLLPVTVQDGGNVSGDCGTIDCSEVIGEWTAVDIPEHDGLIHVILFIWGGAVPGGVQAGDIYVIHDPDSGPTYTISQACTPDTGEPTNAECITVNKVGPNWRIDVWLEDNGTLRGGI